MDIVLLATHNAGKLRELQELTAGLSLIWETLAAHRDVGEAPETGATFAANAREKALYYARATGRLTLADDSGLQVDALGGAPGVHSARYAGSPTDYAANNRKLVAALAEIPSARRTARFHCALALAEPGRVLLEAAGAVEGLIIDVPRGENGFGFDPHFLVPELDRTMAELPAAEKNARSHRGRALRALLPALRDLVARRTHL